MLSFFDGYRTEHTGFGRLISPSVSGRCYETRLILRLPENRRGRFEPRQPIIVLRIDLSSPATAGPFAELESPKFSDWRFSTMNRRCWLRCSNAPFRGPVRLAGIEQAASTA